MPTITKSQRRAYERKLREIAKSLDRVERETLQQSITLLRQVRNSIAGQLTDSDFDQFRVSQQQQAIDDIITGYEAQARALSNGAVRQSFTLGERSAVEPLAEIGIEGAFLRPSEAQVQVLAQFSADLIGGVGQDALRKINRTIQLNALAGNSQIDAMRDITRVLFGTARPPSPRTKQPTKGVAYEAERILRTEVNRSYNLAAFAQTEQLAKDIPGMRKQWIATGDARTRDSHLRLHGEVQPVDKQFSNGLMYPGDPGGPPEETINCRCRQVSVIPEIEDTTLASQADVNAELAKRGQRKPMPEPVQAEGIPVDRERFRAFNAKSKKGAQEIDDWARDSSYKGWTAALTDEERAWLMEYKLDGYEWLNTALRGDMSELEWHGMTPADYRKARSVIDKALTQHRLPDDVTAWRGGAHPALTEALQSGKSLDDLTGMVIGDDAYISTSLNQASADNFYKMAGKDAFKFEIQLPRGANGAYIEGIHDIKEFEFLLPRGSQFEILEASVRGGTRTITMRLI